MPLTAARHLFFESNYAADDKLFGLWVSREVDSFLFDSLLLHNLSDSDRVSGNHLFTFWDFLVLQLLLKSLHHIGIECKIDLLSDVNFDFLLVTRLALHHLSNCWL